MNSDSDSNERIVKEEKPSNIEFQHKKFSEIPESNVPDKANQNELFEVHEKRKMFYGTSEQNIKQERWNPWDVSSIFEFNYFCCPECDFKIQSDEHTETKQEFVDHASSNHPWVSFSVKILRLLLTYEQYFPLISSFFLKEI